MIKNQFGANEYKIIKKETKINNKLIFKIISSHSKGLINFRWVIWFVIIQYQFTVSWNSFNSFSMVWINQGKINKF